MCLTEFCLEKKITKAHKKLCDNIPSLQLNPVVMEHYLDTNTLGKSSGLSLLELSVLNNYKSVSIVMQTLMP